MCSSGSKQALHSAPLHSVLKYWGPYKQRNLFTTSQTLVLSRRCLQGIVQLRILLGVGRGGDTVCVSVTSLCA
jgi:hypothetical protein